jgi:hypothetical protein
MEGRAERSREGSTRLDQERGSRGRAAEGATVVRRDFCLRQGLLPAVRLSDRPLSGRDRDRRGERPAEDGQRILVPGSRLGVLLPRTGFAVATPRRAATHVGAGRIRGFSRTASRVSSRQLDERDKHDDQSLSLRQVSRDEPRQLRVGLLGEE